MNHTQRDLLSIGFCLLLIGLAAFIMQQFFLPLVWAGILCVATWPLYQRLLHKCGGKHILAALLMMLLVLCVALVPALLGLREAIEQGPSIASFIAGANNNGLPVPAVLEHVPLVGSYLVHWWQETLASPHGLAHLMSEDGRVGHMISPGGVLKMLGGQVFHRLIDFGFALLCLFFFYIDGHVLNRQIGQLGVRWFGELRWNRYYSTVPTAIRGTVNGLVLVGLGEGLLIGIGYAVAGLPSSVLWGAATGMLAIVPFGAPLIYLCATAVLLASGSTAAAIGVAVWGTIVLLLADHLVRPTIIGNATRMPFLAVLLGILGGVETLGLVGLFIGPVVMALLITLWRESAAAPLEPAHNADV